MSGPTIIGGAPAGASLFQLQATQAALSLQVGQHDTDIKGDVAAEAAALDAHITGHAITLQSQHTTIQTEVDQIRNVATAGLLGVRNSMAYRVHEIERHLHSIERWLGKLAVQTATDWADDTLTPFVAISGNNTYGTDGGDAALVLGTDDTPACSLGGVYYDLHEIFVLAASSSSVWKMRLIWSDVDMATGLAAGQWTEIMTTHDSFGSATIEKPTAIQMPRLRCGVDMVWAQAWNASNNATVSFLVGLHEYEG